jgi:hypothetical protein
MRFAYLIPILKKRSSGTIVIIPDTSPNAYGEWPVETPTIDAVSLDNSKIVVDLATDNGTPKYWGNGYLMAANAIWPPADIFDPLRFQFKRGGDNNAFDPPGWEPPMDWPRFRASGMKQYQGIFNNHWDPGVTAWGANKIDALLNTIKHYKSLGQEFTIDLVNEPEQSMTVSYDIYGNRYPGYMWESWMSETDYMSNYFTYTDDLVAAVLAFDPNIKITGPDLGHYEDDKIKLFIDHYAARGWLANTIISWHPLLNPPDEPQNPESATLYQQYQSVRDYCTLHGYPQPMIALQEVVKEMPDVGSGVAEAPSYEVSTHLNYFSAAERMKVRMAKAIWTGQLQAGIGTPANVRGDRQAANYIWTFETPSDQTESYPPSSRVSRPRGLWWLYKSYADMSGKMVTVYRNQNIDGLASVDSSLGKALIIVGPKENVSNGSTTVKVNNIPDWLKSGGNVNVKIEHIPTTYDPLLSLTVVTTTSIAVAGDNSISIPVTIPSTSAYRITLGSDVQAPPEVGVSDNETLILGTTKYVTYANNHFANGSFRNNNTTILYATARTNTTTGSIVSRQWMQASGPTTVAMYGTDSYRNIVTIPPIEGVWGFDFTATDNLGQSTTKRVTITTVAPPGYHTKKYYSCHYMVALDGFGRNAVDFVTRLKAAGYNLIWAHCEFNDSTEYDQYKTKIDELFAAAASVGGIEIIPGTAGFTPVNLQVKFIIDMWNKPALLHVNGRRVFAAYDYRKNYLTEVMEVLQRSLHGVIGGDENYSTNFWYHLDMWAHSYYPYPNGSGGWVGEDTGGNSFAFAESDVTHIYEDKPNVSGLINFSVGEGFPSPYSNTEILNRVRNTNAYITAASLARFKYAIVGISKFYTNKDVSFQDFSFRGSALLWQDIIDLPPSQRPQGVCDVTANDFKERSYVSPLANPPVNGYHLQPEFANDPAMPLAILDHSGMQAFDRPFATAYLTNQTAVTITTEKMFCQYWLHLPGTVGTSTIPAELVGLVTQTQWDASIYSVTGFAAINEWLEATLDGVPVIPGYGKIMMSAHLTAPGYLKINGTMSSLMSAGIAYFEITAVLGTPTFSIIETDGTTVRMTGSGKQAIVNSSYPGGGNYLSHEIEIVA